MLRYSLMINDTVRIGKEASTVLTEGCTKLSDVVMELEVSSRFPQSCGANENSRTTRTMSPNLFPKQMDPRQKRKEW